MKRAASECGPPWGETGYKVTAWLLRGPHCAEGGCVTKKDMIVLTAWLIRDPCWVNQQVRNQEGQDHLVSPHGGPH